MSYSDYFSRFQITKLCKSSRRYKIVGLSISKICLIIYEVVLAIHFFLKKRKRHGCVLVKTSRNGAYREFQKQLALFHFLPSFNGTATLDEPESKIGHWKSLSLGSYNGRPFITGGSWPHNKRTEIFNVNSREWEEYDEYPFSQSTR